MSEYVNWRLQIPLVVLVTLVIIALTANTMEGDEEECLSAGMSVAQFWPHPPYR